MSQQDQPLLSYATPSAAPARPSRYAAASLLVSFLSVLWLVAMFAGSLPFLPSKQHRIGSVASVLAIALAFAAYRRPHRKRKLAIVALCVAGCIFMLYMLVVPL